MKCSACRNQIGAFQDEAVPAGVAMQIRTHLETCLGCRTFAEEMMVVEHRLSRLSELEPRVDFTRLVMTAVATMPAPAPRRSRIMWLGVYDLLAWAAMIALAAMTDAQIKLAGFIAAPLIVRFWCGRSWDGQ